MLVEVIPASDRQDSLTRAVWQTDVGKERRQKVMKEGGKDTDGLIKCVYGKRGVVQVWTEWMQGDCKLQSWDRDTDPLATRQQSAGG